MNILLGRLSDMAANYQTTDAVLSSSENADLPRSVLKSLRRERKFASAESLRLVSAATSQGEDAADIREAVETGVNVGVSRGLQIAAELEGAEGGGRRAAASLPRH